jgi:all-trans-retinol dehydrogenase (NAD+)
MTTIAGKTVLITGGAAGIGRLVGLKMAALGASVCVWDIDEAALGAAVAGLQEAGARSAHGFVCDVSDRAMVSEVAGATEAAAGSVDILVNNAGVVSGKYFVDLTPEEIERTFAVNTLSLFWVTKAFLPQMIHRGAGHIVTVSSAAGLIGTPKETDYAASKFAAFGFDEALRQELRCTAPGVLTTIVCPYYIDTGMFAGVRTRVPLLLPILKEDKVARRIVRAVQLNRRRLFMPPMVYTTPPLRLLPVPLFDWISDLFGVNACMDDFVGRRNDDEQKRDEGDRRAAAD